MEVSQHARGAELRVLLDISVLGLGHLDRRARAGIFRAAESVTDGLIARSDVAVSLAACESWLHGLATELYASARGPGYTDRLLPAWRFVPGARRLVAERSRATWARRDHWLGSRLRRVWHRLRPLHEGLNRPRKLGPFDIHHSLFYSLSQRHGVQARARFVTVYDVIPIVMPELFEAKLVGDFRRQLEALDRENDWIVCISAATRRDLCRETGFPPGRVFVTPLAASGHFRRETDPGRLDEVLLRHGLKGTRYILSVSTLEPRKNLAHLIRSYSRVARTTAGKDVSLVLVGSKGWLYGEIFDALEEARDLSDRILFTGYVADEDLAAIYTGAEFFAYPSLYEGFGLPPLEAMQCGLPVVASGTSSLPEVVGEAGLLIDPRDPDQLSEAIETLLRDEGLRETLAARAAERATQFSWRRCVDDLVTAYRRALAADASDRDPRHTA